MKESKRIDENKRKNWMLEENSSQSKANVK